MPTLRSAIALRDQISNRLEKIYGGLQKIAAGGNEMGSAVTEQIDKVQRTAERVDLTPMVTNMTQASNVKLIGGDEINKMDTIVRQAELLEHKWINQQNIVASLKQEYDKVVSSLGAGSEKAMKLDSALIKAQIQENNLALQCVRTNEAIERQANSGKKVEQSVANQQLAEQRVEKAIIDKQLSEQRLEHETEKTNLTLLKQQQLEEKIGREQELYNQKLKEGGNHANDLLDKLKNIAGVYLSFTAIKKALNSTFGAAGKLQQQIVVMQGMFGDTNIGAAYFEELQKYAVLSKRSLEDLTDVTQQFLAFTRNTDKLKELTQIADKLAIRNPKRGIGGAADAISQALNGTYTSLKRSYALPKAAISQIEDAVKTGNIDGITKAFDNALNMSGITDEVVDAYRASAPQQLSNIIGTFKNKLAQAGIGAVETLQPVLGCIEEWMNSERAAQFFGVIENGLSMIAGGAAWAADAVSQNWEVIKPILFTAGIMLSMLAVTSAVSAASSAHAWLIVAWPILLLAAAITGVIIRLKQMGVTTEQIVGFVGGIFGAGVAFIYNQFVLLYNHLVNFAEFIANFCIDPVYAIKKLFYDLVINVLKFWDNMLRGIASGINWVIDKINQVTGSSIQQVQVNMSNKLIDDLELTGNSLQSDKNIVDLSGMKLEYMDVSKSASIGAEKTTNLLKTLSDKTDNLTHSFDDWNKAQTDNLNAIKDDTGKISKSVDISEQDLKYLRDIAEQESINNITSNTIVPQLQITFGDVKETADVERIYGRITEMVTEELAILAEGVHL